MNVPGVAWVGLILLLIPVIQSWLSTQWPGAAYPLTALIVGVLGALAKWLDMYLSKPKELPQGVEGAQEFTELKESRSAVRTWLVG